MTTTVCLLGTPSILHDDERVAMKGTKAWGLLTYLALTRVPHTREHLSELLFPEADDPLRALRWNLTELRRVTAAEISGDPVTMSLPDGTVVDFDVMRRASWRDAIALPSIGGQLLEGMVFDGCPSFETWLLVQRRRMRSATDAVLREGALAALASADYETAIDLAARLVASDPLREDAQALLVRSYVAAGDHIEAARQVEACARLLQRELGTEPGPELAAALAVSPSSATTAAVGGRAAAQAQLEAGRAAVRAGAFDAGSECLRRATAEAHACGDVSLKAETLFELGTALAHSGRNLREQGAGALHEALTLAEVSGNAEVEGRACYELAWVDFLDARYDRAALWLERAERFSHDELRAAVLWVRGKLEMETGHYAASIDSLERAVEAATRVGDDFRRGFALASLGRSHLLLEELDSAISSLEESLATVRERAPVLVPIAEGFLADAWLLAGRTTPARELAEHAYAYALEVGDVSMIAIAGRSLARVDAETGAPDAAIARLRDVRDRFHRSPDHLWTFVFALDALCSVAIDRGAPDTAILVEEMSALAATGPMPEMTVRSLLHRVALGDLDASLAAATLAAEVDNPALHRLVEGRLQLASRDG